MNVNKKLDRFKQWAGERMGGEVKTNVSDDFKALEMEMNLRHDGMEKMHRSMTTYVKAISKRKEGDDKEKTLPIAHLGSVMIQHGEDFDSHSDFGRSLALTGRAHERLARLQDSYSVQASTTWLEALERSLASLKEYQNARKKLESRRLAYDTSLAKMQKAKKEDFRVEEELRSQKIKYEETNDDVFRRMMDIQEAEGENLADLTAFIDAELNYHERCHEVLLQLRNELPAANQPMSQGNSRRPSRARSNTAHSYQERYQPVQEASPPSPPRPMIKARRSSTFFAQNDDTPQTRQEPVYSRPSISRHSTYDSSTQMRNDESYTPNRAHSDLSVRTARGNLRPVSKIYEDYQDSSSYGNVSPYDDRSESSAASQNGYFSRTPSSSALNAPAAKKGPPPPPPSRATKPKPPPPPPPAKRNLIGA